MATDVRTKVSLGIFIATFVYSLLVLADVAPGDTVYVPQCSVLLAVLLVGVSTLLFLEILARVTATVRSGRVVTDVARLGRQVIDATYPEPTRLPSGVSSEPIAAETATFVVVNPRHGGGVIQAMHAEGVVSAAEQLDVTVEMVSPVGEFVPSFAPVFRLYGDVDPEEAERLLDWVALGDERTFRQDPGFAFRVLVDIAIRALSPAVNDPTTAVDAIGRIGDMLAFVGSRRLSDGAFHTKDGRLRFIYPTPTWEDFLALAVTEIRVYGHDSPSVVSAMRRMLDGLTNLTQPWRHDAIRHQRALLDRDAANAGL